MLAKIHKTHGSHRNYLKPKSDINTSFGLNHFAGVVFYDTRSFLEKNRDTFSADLLQLIHISSNKFLQACFVEDIGMGSETRKRAPTLSTQFKKSLDSLMKTLCSCQPFFIRCIKPNEYKKPMVRASIVQISFNFIVSQRQLTQKQHLISDVRSGSLLPAIKILWYDGDH